MANKVNRSGIGNVLMALFIGTVALLMAIPLYYAIVNSLKPLNELWIFPPKLYVVQPTLKNYSDLIILMSDSWVPFSRYFFNTVFITVAGTAGQIVVASLAAYPLAKHDFPGKNIMFSIVVLSLMFNSTVTAIPNYLIMSKIGWIDTYQALIVPAIGASLGLYLMKQFMGQIHNAILEAAKIDGAPERVIFWRIVMPMVKPAWLTLIIFSVQGLWNTGANNYIYDESLKTLPYALNQIVSGGIARAGVASAISVLLLSVPVLIFVLTQSNIIETMSTSGMKD